MTRRSKTPDWELYERLVARLLADQLQTDLCVTPNARIVGKNSGRSRQIDVLIEPRHDTDNTRRIVVDAKHRKRKIDITDVEAFLGLMKDVGATHGYLISPFDPTKAAERRAQMAVSLRIVPLSRLENFDPSTWPRCKDPKCTRGRIFWDGYPEFSLRLRPINATADQEPTLTSFIHYVGKCDRCGLFHVWCITCNDILAIPHDEDADIGHRCKCAKPWFWLASVEADEQGARSAELHAILGAEIVTVDRRGL